MHLRGWASADSVEIMDSAPARSAPLKKCFENFMVMVLKPFIDLYEVQFLNICMCISIMLVA
jgi:hypothetical protein